MPNLCWARSFHPSNGLFRRSRRRRALLRPERYGKPRPSEAMMPERVTVTALKMRTVANKTLPYSRSEQKPMTRLDPPARLYQLRLREDTIFLAVGRCVTYLLKVRIAPCSAFIGRASPRAHANAATAAFAGRQPMGHALDQAYPPFPRRRVPRRSAPIFSFLACTSEPSDFSDELRH